MDIEIPTQGCDSITSSINEPIIQAYLAVDAVSVLIGLGGLISWITVKRWRPSATQVFRWHQFSFLLFFFLLLVEIFQSTAFENVANQTNLE
jgi:hypothetical protein